jgi:hypothetical protein
MKNNGTYKILGFATGCINTLLLYDVAYLYYRYHFTNLLFLFMYPDEMLLLNAILSLIGVFISILFYHRRIGISLFFSVTATIWCLTALNYVYFS